MEKNCCSGKFNIRMNVRMFVSNVRNVDLNICCNTTLGLPLCMPSGHKTSAADVGSNPSKFHGPSVPTGGMVFVPWCPEYAADLRHLITQAGDIEKNPGPDTCPLCNKRARYDCLRCGDCRLWHHTSCLKMTCAEIKSWSTWRWHCGCRDPPQDNKPNTARRTADRVAQLKPRQQPPTQGKAASILQVNIDGWRGKNTVLNKILDELKPVVVVLQETKLKKKTEAPKVPNYTAITEERKVHRTQASELPQSGLAILICNTVTVKKVLGSLTTPHRAALETLGVRVQFQKGELDIWNIYRPPARDERALARHGKHCDLLRRFLGRPADYGHPRR